MPLTASCPGEDPSPVASSPPAGCGAVPDPSHPLPSFAFVISQLSSLLLTTCSDSDGAYARQLLLFALSNVLFTSLHATSLAGAPLSPLTPAVQATPAPIVPTPVTESPSPFQPPLPTSLADPNTQTIFSLSKNCYANTKPYLRYLLRKLLE